MKGEVQKNINNHLRVIENAIKLQADLIIFPELSITGYEPDLAKELATNVEDPIFNPFQELANQHEITIGIGMPIKAEEGIYISMLIFQPNKKRTVYSKQMLHEDELPYFVCGHHQTFLNIKSTKIAIGICYETLQPEHFINAKQNGAEVYIASVAKSKAGIEKAHVHFPKIAKEFKTPILMANSIGFCDNFMSAGNSAFWNKNGELLSQLDSDNDGILMYDTSLETAETFQLKIEKAHLTDLEEIFQIYQNGKSELERNGLNQWTDNYPTIAIIQNDLEKGYMYVLKNGSEIIGAINISEEQEAEYQNVDWKFNDSKVLVIHRLVVDPKYQRQGYAKQLMDFAEDFAKNNDYSSIRLDAYSANKGVIEFYKKRNYIQRGNVNFPGREHPFYCMEKEVK